MTAPTPPSTFRVEVLHNVTTCAEAVAVGGPHNDYLTGDLAARADASAIFLRYPGRPRLVAGDRLRAVVVLDLPAASAQGAASAAFAAGNSPYADPGVEAYAAARVRSLSVGDVVIVETPDGPAAFACDSFGWSSVDLRDYRVERAA